jgi:hypothetical protein
MLHQEQFANDKGNDTTEKEVSEIDNGVVKWPTKTVLLDTDMFEVDDSWHDTPPEGFSLTVSILQKKKYHFCCLLYNPFRIKPDMHIFSAVCFCNNVGHTIWMDIPVIFSLCVHA